MQKAVEDFKARTGREVWQNPLNSSKFHVKLYLEESDDLEKLDEFIEEEAEERPNGKLYFPFAELPIVNNKVNLHSKAYYEVRGDKLIEARNQNECFSFFEFEEEHAVDDFGFPKEQVDAYQQPPKRELSEVVQKKAEQKEPKKGKRKQRA